MAFQGSQDPLAIPVKEVLPGSQDNRDFLELQAYQELMVSEGLLGFQAPMGKMVYLVFQA